MRDDELRDRLAGRPAGAPPTRPPGRVRIAGDGRRPPAGLLLAGAGLVLGVGAGVLVLSAMGPAGAAATPSPAAASSAPPDPSPTAAATAEPTASPVASAPAAVAAALRGNGVLLEQLAAEAPALEQLAASGSGGDVVRRLRAMSTQVRSSGTLVATLEAWPAATIFAGSLRDFYGGLATRLDAALDRSVADEAALRADAAAVLAALKGLPALDAAGREFGATVGVFVPSIQIPAVLGG